MLTTFAAITLAGCGEAQVALNMIGEGKTPAVNVSSAPVS